jgi:hypothetical protein
VALCQARISTKPLWGFSSSNPYHSQSRAEHRSLSIFSTTLKGQFYKISVAQYHPQQQIIRALIFKLLRSQRIDSNESIPPAYVAWRAGTTTLFLLGS